jgi:hypothetical protein
MYAGYPYMPIPASGAPMHPPAYQPFNYPSVPMDEKVAFGNSPPPQFPGFNIPPNSNGGDEKVLNIAGFKVIFIQSLASRES